MASIWRLDLADWLGYEAAMSAIRFVQLQHPVGQGGFHTGWLYSSAAPVSIGPLIDDPLLFWAYDCGSDQLSLLKHELLRVRGAPIDVLFLSHLDDDHVAGVDTLLTTAARVDEVIVPYLDDDGWALHLAASASMGTLSGTFIDLAADPAGWFGRRGVRRLTYVECSDDEDDAGPGPDPVEPSGIDPDLRGESKEPLGRLKIKWSRRPRTLQSAGAQTARAETAVVERGVVVVLHGFGTTLNWVPSPFAFRPERAKIAAFRAQLAAEFGPGMTATAYADQARSHSGRMKLRKCYDVVCKKDNLHSMTLYAGPAAALQGKLPNTAWHGHFSRRIVQAGWLSTGDFDLSVKKRRDSLIRFFSRYAHLVGQLTLPHHGSEHSFHRAILTAYPDLASALAAVGANGHGHPSLTVQRTVSASSSLAFVRVDENPSSEFGVMGPVG